MFSHNDDLTFFFPNMHGYPVPQVLRRTLILLLFNGIRGIMEIKSRVPKKHYSDIMVWWPVYKWTMRGFMSLFHNLCLLPLWHTQRTTTPNLSIQTKTQLHRSGITFYKNQHTALFLDCAVRLTLVFLLYSMDIIAITVMSSGLTRVSQRKQHF